MIKSAIALTAVYALALPTAAFAAPQINITPGGPVVELGAFESVEAAPDLATIGAGVVTEAPTATEAMRLSAEAMTKVIARIKALGIAEKDIQTSGIGLSAQYDYGDGGAKFRAYQASNRVSVILRKVAESGKVLDALVEAGATDLFGPEFAIEDPAPAKEQARTRAVARLDAQARAYAKLLGYSGVKVLSVTEAFDSGFPVFEAAKVAQIAPTSAGTPVQPGTVSTGVGITITYELVGQAAPAGTK